MRNKKDLHIATCIDELHIKIKVPDKLKNQDLCVYVLLVFCKQLFNNISMFQLFLVLHRLNKKAKTLFDHAMIANNENDEETVYIYLMKYCEIVQIMKNTFVNDTDYIINMNKSSLKTSMCMLSHIKSSLENR